MIFPPESPAPAQSKVDRDSGEVGGGTPFSTFVLSFGPHLAVDRYQAHLQKHSENITKETELVTKLALPDAVPS